MTVCGLPVPADGPGPTGDTPGPVPQSLVGDGSNRTYLPAEIESVQELLTLDGSERVLDVDWSPDGKYLAVGSRTNAGTGPFRLYSFNGTALTTVVSWTDSSSVSTLAWSPDGNYLAYGPGKTGNNVKIFGFNGTALTEVASNSFRSPSRMAWSHNGTYLAVVGSNFPTSLSVFEFNGTALTLVDDFVTQNSARYVTWSPDGAHLAITWNYWEDNFPDIIYLGKVVILSFDGSSLRTELQTDMGENVYSIDWSPDGDHLALGYEDFPGRYLDVFNTYLDRNGKMVMNLEDSYDLGVAVYGMDWSSNGQYLAVGGSSAGHECHICSFDGSILSTESSWVFGGGWVIDLDWSPDGNYLAIGGRDGSRDLKVYGVDYGQLGRNDTMVVNEDTPTTLDVLANDRTTSGNLTITNVTSATQGLVQITPDGRDLWYTPPDNWSGNVSVTYRHSDMDDATPWPVVNITVNPVNDLPVISTGDVVVAMEDEEYMVQYEATDADPDDTLTWSFDSDAEWLTFEDVAGVLHGTPTNDDVGSYFVEVKVTDTNGTDDIHGFLLTVENVNDPPVITSEDITVAEEDAVYNVYYKALDVDPTNDDLVWDVETDAGWLAMRENHLTGTPTNDDVGDHVVNVSISDGNGGMGWSEFTITVANTNDAPRILTTPSSVASEDEEYVQAFEAEDVDVGDVLEWTMTGPDWLTIDGAVLSGTPSNDEVGTHQVTVAVSDGEAEVLVSFIIKVANTNDEPVWLSTPDDQQLMEGDLMFLDVIAEDEDGDRLTYGLTSTPSSGMRINPATGAIRWLDAVPGEYAVQITASDGEETLTHDLTVEVAEPPVPPANKVPVIQAVVVGNATAGEAFTLTISGSDEDPWDAGNLTFTLVSGPAGMVVSADGTVLWLPTDDQVGTHPVVVSLSDSKNATTQDFDVDVVEGDDVEETTSDYMWAMIAMAIVVVILVVLLVIMYTRQR